MYIPSAKTLWTLFVVYLVLVALAFNHDATGFARYAPLFFGLPLVGLFGVLFFRFTDNRKVAT